MGEFSQYLSLAAFISFLPICFYIFQKQPDSMIFWLLILCPFVMSLAYCLARISYGWHTDFVTSLWVSIATGLALFIGLSIYSVNMRRLAILFLPYMALFAASATLWGAFIDFQTVDQPIHPSKVSWLFVHIASSVLTYGLITLAAVSALAVYIRELALKSKRKSSLVDRLPAMADSEYIQIRLMVISEIILGVGLLSGVATEIMQGGSWIHIDHKVILSFVAFVILAILLLAHFKSGMHRKKATKVLLLCYLLVTMGFLGVKFITNILIGR